MAPSLVAKYACNHQTQEVSPKKGTASSQVNDSCLDGISMWSSFEDLFFKKTYFRGEHQLDRVLKSLLTLVDSCAQYEHKGRTILIDRANARRNILRQTTPIVDRFKLMRKREGKDFNFLKFLITNSIPLDTISGCYPLVFRDFRRIIHSLRLSWAFYLTLKMKKFDNFAFSQRTRKGYFMRRNKDHLSEIFIHLYSSLCKLGISDEKRIIKCFKNSLCYHVSTSLEQTELPEGDRFDLVPLQFRGFFRLIESEKKINFFFSLLQSKVLCEEVPKSFVQDALKKHHKQLSSEHPGVSKQALDDLYKRGQEFGKKVVKYYNPLKGFLPTNKATCHFPRDRGGVKGDLVYHNRLKTGQGNNPHDRAEPFVIGLFGQPGQGKSTAISKLLGSLRTLFPGVPLKDLTYERTCNVEYWDGYKDQPIVIMDDIGQQKSGKDISEFQTLVSCNPYVLPMAELNEKGALFNSSIIILTSNLKYGEKLNSIYPETSQILDEASFWRRVHIPIYVEKKMYYRLRNDPSWIRPENLLYGQHAKDRASRIRVSKCGNGYLNPESYYQQLPEFRARDNQSWNEWFQCLWKEEPENMSLLCRDLKKEFKIRELFHDNIRKTWTQSIKSTFDDTMTQVGKDLFQKEIEPLLPESLGSPMMKCSESNTFKLEFEAFPPDEPLPVRVEPITEPLKVRTITAGLGDTFCLKPLQRAMWKALGTEPQFCLTHGTNRLETAIERIYNNSNSDDVWISGDYTAATDSFSIEASKALLEGILESIEHEPTKRWAMKEISPHLLVYPKESGLEPVLQKSGQLMGSLLSFPLLCLLNDCTAQSIGMSPEMYLINGDDILMRTNAENYPIWKERVQDFGLSLSLGKNYVHKDFGTVNSQLILRGEVLNSGKQRVLDRRVQILGECLRDLEMNMGDTPTNDIQELFKVVNRKKLSKTVRSIHVPVTHGGLALSWGDRDLQEQSRRTEILVYLHDFFKKIEPKSDCVSIPYLSIDKMMDEDSKTLEETFFDFLESKELHEDFLSSKALPFVKSRLMKNPHLRDLFLGQKIENLPPLSFLHVVQVPFKDKAVKKSLQNAIDQSFFQLFFNGNSDYNYHLFRKLFLCKAMNLQADTSVSREFLVNFADLNLQPDFLSKIPVGYVPREFDSEIFIKQLSKGLEPKQFDLPSCPESTDFSKQIVHDFNVLKQSLLDESEDAGILVVNREELLLDLENVRNPPLREEKTLQNH